MQRLFIYGSLQPGGPNHHVMESIGGDWQKATLKGRLVESGWGSSLGYPGLVLGEDGAEVEGYLFASPNLDEKWAELDAFEGEEYVRTRVRARRPDGELVEAYVYALRG